MLIMVISGVIFWLFADINYVSALAIAACLTPTDPIVCATIVGKILDVVYLQATLLTIAS